MQRARITVGAARVLVALLALGAVALGAACSESARPPVLGDCVDTNGRCGAILPAVSAGASSCGKLASPIAACQTCFTSACCVEGAACSNDAACLSLVDCAQSCTDDACFAACEAKSVTGTSAYRAFTGCIAAQCTAACGGASGGDDAGAATASCGQITSPIAACAACLTRACCAEDRACSADSECLATLACLSQCAVTDRACQATCRTRSASALASYDRFVACADSACSAECR